MKAYSFVFIIIISCVYPFTGLATSSYLWHKKRTFYVNAVSGNDAHSGTSAKQAWKTFSILNRMQLQGGDEVIITPGSYRSSLILRASGTVSSPVTARLTPGDYHFYPDSAYRSKFHISNTNDEPYGDKLIAIYLKDSHNLKLTSVGAKVIIHGKMIETAIDHSSNITISGLTFDYARPTVSEVLVTKVTPEYADLQVSSKSTYNIQDSILWWEGEGWKYRPDWYWQVFDKNSGYVERQSFDLKAAKFVQLGANAVRVYYPNDLGFKEGMIYQNRDITRDCVGILLQYSNNIRLKDIRIYYMHGMGIVSQFCKDLKFERVVVDPPEGTDRTCSAWADILHFSGCSGLIEVSHCYLSSSNDDAINIHGTHLKVISAIDRHRLKVKFMHNQSFGFEAFFPGDSIDFIQAESLLPFETNVIKDAEVLNEREILLTLKDPIKGDLTGDVVLENITRTPKVWIHHTTITKIPTRGILITTRRNTVIENNYFDRVNWNAILIANDAESWFESGLVRNMRIRKNNFFECGGPVICVAPENKKHEGPVHSYIEVDNNHFRIRSAGKAFAARSSADLIFRNNRIAVKRDSGAAMKDFTEFSNCDKITLSSNKIVIE